MISARGKELPFKAITIRVNDLCKWIAVVMAMSKAAKKKLQFNNKTILGPKWIYRGQANSGWEISSSFERNILSKAPESMKQNEHGLRAIEKMSMINFQRWADAPRQSSPLTSGEWLALMQHHCVPTRLVDFTEVPLIALGFALEDDKQEESDFAIWSVKRNSFNCEYSKEEVFSGACEGEKKIVLYDNLSFRVHAEEYDRGKLEKILDDEKGIPPVPFLMRYNPIGMNTRQKLQRGLFLTSSHLSEKFMPLLHKWTDTSAVDFKNTDLELYVGDVLKEDGSFVNTVAVAHIIKFVFDKALRKDARVLLESCNIGPRTRYGDNDRVAEETKMMMQDSL